MLNLKIFDLVIFRDKYGLYCDPEIINFLEKEKNVVLNEVIEIANTKNYRIKLFENGLILVNGTNSDTFYDNVEVAGIWRFNTQTKNYDLIYNNNLEDLFNTEE